MFTIKRYIALQSRRYFILHKQNKYKKTKMPKYGHLCRHLSTITY